MILRRYAMHGVAAGAVDAATPCVYKYGWLMRYDICRAAASTAPMMTPASPSFDATRCHAAAASTQRRC